jgi:uncharacterized protein (DUF1501 family)
MRRRDFLLTGSATAATAFASFTLLGPEAFAQAKTSGWRADRTLVVIELAGGNDGLNTVVPYADAGYQRLRPGIAIKRESVVQLDEKVGLHPSLAPLADAFKVGELAIVQGVGYENPNRSHFRSIDIWDTASGSNRLLTEGWVSRVIGGSRRAAERLADAVVLGGGTGPVTGSGLRAVSMPDPQRFLRQAEGMQTAEGRPANPALAHVIKVQSEIQDTAKELRQVLARAPDVRGEFPNGPLAQQLRIAARLINAKAVVPVVKLALGGFDTHANQPGQHANLLRQLGDGLAAFRKALAEAGRWNDVLVMTYSEFGRRAAQNGSNGTDHGTAAPHFVLGGKVKGGLFGAAPDLSDLVNGDLKHAIDYRSLYATAAQTWWGFARTSALGDHAPLPILKV